MVNSLKIAKKLNIKDPSNRLQSLYGFNENTLTRISNHLPKFNNLVDSINDIQYDSFYIFIILIGNKRFIDINTDEKCEEYSNSLADDLTEYLGKEIYVETYFIDENVSIEDLEIDCSYIKNRIDINI